MDSSRRFAPHASFGSLTRREALLGATAALIGAAIPAEAASTKTIRAVMHAPLRLIDPITTTAYISRDHGYMIYDTLVAADENFQPQPQMAEWVISDDKLVYTFKLREGLAWHDGPPVTAEDCVASLKRWWQRDTMGQLLASYTTSLDASDPRTIVLKLKQPAGFVLDALGKPSSNVPFMMPKRVADTPATQPITETIGSGPFKFLKEEFQPGVRAVYVKNEKYVPRKEKPSWTSGGKVVKVDRVEWVVMPDAQTAINALANGEIDYIDEPQVDLLKLFEGSNDVVVKNNNKFGLQVLARMNFLAPPFTNEKIRRAAMLAFKQENFLAAMVGDPSGYKVCGAMFVCGTTLATDIGSESLVKGDGMVEARRLLKEANYDGKPIRIIQPTDVNTQKAQPIVGAQALKDAGFNVELLPMDWQTAVATRSNAKLAQEGGWHMYFTALGGAEMSNPLTSAPLNAIGAAGYPGWPDDKEIQALRIRFAEAGSLDERKKVAAELQKLAYEHVIYVPLGQIATPAAWSAKLTGVLDGPAVPYFWNMDKS
ncbi:ABC transporter substrate-binding protein [Bradyrhizobium iriomotense]|uniref:ABC transporter substrate-binding protein n=1 Tax=Bradyrhizobium iriomotense TaxID=441950 RepID=UPI001B8A62ED|nr:ABC transporter substrate-binding protein [Bradyrhizobium iriomotense]